MMMMMAAMCCCMLVVSCCGGCGLFLFKSGGLGGGTPSGTNSPTYVEYACPPGKGWGTGAASTKCCNTNQDMSNVANCSDPLEIKVPTLYRDSEFKSDSLAMTIGDVASMPNGWNDAASSVRVPTGYRVEAYKDTNFVGKSQTFTSSTSNLGSYDFNDATSSYRVTKV